MVNYWEYFFQQMLFTGRHWSLQQAGHKIGNCGAVEPGIFAKETRFDKIIDFRNGAETKLDETISDSFQTKSSAVDIRPEITNIFEFI